MNSLEQLESAHIVGLGIIEVAADPPQPVARYVQLRQRLRIFSPDYSGLKQSRALIRRTLTRSEVVDLRRSRYSVIPGFGRACATTCNLLQHAVGPGLDPSPGAGGAGRP